MLKTTGKQNKKTIAHKDAEEAEANIEWALKERNYVEALQAIEEQAEAMRLTIEEYDGDTGLCMPSHAAELSPMEMVYHHGISVASRE